MNVGKGAYFAVNSEKFRRSTECELFKTMRTGFVTQGNFEDPCTRQEILRAFNKTAAFLRKFLWPFPLGGGYAYLRYLASKGDFEAMQGLLQLGVPAGGRDSLDEVEQPPILYAARDGHREAIKLLAQYEADVNEVGGIPFETALHVAVQSHKLKVVQMLLSLRADPQIKDAGGQGPLHRAAREGAIHSLQTLITAGAAVDMRDTCEQAPIHIATYFGREEVVRALLAARADAVAENIRGQTPRKVADRLGYTTIVQIIDKEIERREIDELYAAEERDRAEQQLKALLESEATENRQRQLDLWRLQREDSGTVVAANAEKRRRRRANPPSWQSLWWQWEEAWNWFVALFVWGLRRAGRSVAGKKYRTVRTDVTTFNTRYSLLSYAMMASDEKKSASFRRALQRCAKQLRSRGNPMVVLEIGCGAYAPFARICTEEGADKVLAIEGNSWAAARAQRLLGEGAKVFAGLSQDMVPERLGALASVVVMETIGDWAANEYMVSTFLDARGRLCEPTSQWIPGQVKTRFMPVTIPPWGQEGAVPPGLWLLGSDARYERLALSEAETLEAYDFNEWKDEMLKQHRSCDFEIQTSADLQGFLLWVEVFPDRAEDAPLSALCDVDISWSPLLLALPETRRLERGDRLSCRVEALPAALDGPELRIELPQEDGRTLKFEWTLARGARWILPEGREISFEDQPEDVLSSEQVKAETGNGGSAVMLCCRCILLLAYVQSIKTKREIIRRQVVKTIYPAGYPNPEEVSGSGYFGF
ncbi:Ankyrin repeat and SOCS box protein 2 [Symbiodinium microadriaticum]|uniref:Ankyrin repeat and SOCS box protein 2 n=1 Tax=Symbiodinium microadriaticum TaxID=2951 RepID=A0A1Q9ER54_SYMMI|nr:Ankyrin repeat and SOCS box protein 2 [Symbiodinium microadriaticum]